ncbi:MAG TPA: phasin family protein [Rhodocyclaceae bacterium]|nr:phasin family protein [Rhodocyclaceae bacterium]
MATKPEQFSELHRKNMEAAMQLAQMSIENSQRIVTLQVEVAKALFQDSVDNAKALAAAKDPQQAVTLRTHYTQETTQKMIEAAREIAEIGNDSRSEFSRLLSEQLASGSKDMMEAFQSFFGSLPGQNTQVMETMQQAMAKANKAFDQISQASAVFGGEAPKKKTTRK